VCFWWQCAKEAWSCWGCFCLWGWWLWNGWKALRMLMWQTLTCNMSVEEVSTDLWWLVLLLLMALLLKELVFIPSAHLPNFFALISPCKWSLFKSFTLILMPLYWFAWSNKWFARNNCFVHLVSAFKSYLCIPIYYIVPTLLLHELTIENDEETCHLFLKHDY